MKLFTHWRLVATLLLALGGGFATPALDHAEAAANAGQQGDLAADLHADNGKDKGNDDKEKKDKKEKDDKKGKEQVEATAGYTVTAACTPASDDTTACTFSATAPEGGKKIQLLELAASEVCAEVLGGEYTYVDPDPHANITGYQSKGETFTLILDGVVTTGGATTYWIKAANYVFPASGPGLVCGEPEAAATPPSTPAIETGTVVVQIATCGDVGTDTSGFDWFGACDAGEAGHAFTLTPLDTGSDEVAAAATSKTGIATFGDLAPGTWDLADPARHWCHAESNNVNAEGNVVVTAGGETTVWLFYCDPASGS